MTRTSSLALLLALSACNDSAEVLTPDTGTPEAGSDVQTSDVTTQPDASDATTNDAPSESATDAPADVAPTCEAGLVVCNNVCTDPSTFANDNKNCGFCGHDCLGNACATGMCALDTIGSALPSRRTSPSMARTFTSRPRATRSRRRAERSTGARSPVARRSSDR